MVRIVGADGLCGVKADRRTYRTTVSVAVLGNHTFQVGVYFQMVFKERRSQADRSRITFELGCFHNTVLVGITERYTVRHILQSTGNGEVMVCTYGWAEYFFLPVGVGIS